MTHTIKEHRQNIISDNVYNKSLCVVRTLNLYDFKPLKVFRTKYVIQVYIIYNIQMSLYFSSNFEYGHNNKPFQKKYSTVSITITIFQFSL